MNYNSSNIIDASIQDSQEIFDLLRSSFHFNYLIYSIYLSDKSITQIVKIIEHQKKNNYAEFIRVLKDDEKVLGFYNAKVFEDSLFLNYIGTKRGYENRNIGSLLLSDFHDFGSVLGFKKFLLDVYLSNEIAYNWYLKNGYEIVKITNNICFRNSRLNYKGKISNQFLNKEIIGGKLQYEIEHGFSTTEISKNKFSFTVTMIDGRVLRFQKVSNITTDEVIDMVFCSELSNREYFVFIGSQKYQGKHRLEFVEEVFRMMKSVN